jgi:hypothetical protein
MENSPINVSWLLQEALRMEQWCGNTQISFYPQKAQDLNII